MKDCEKNILFSCGLFKGLSREECERLSECLRINTRSYQKGETVWHIGDCIRSCAVVLSGRATAESIGFNGDRTVLASNGPGAVVGDVIMSTENSQSPVELIMSEAGSLAFLGYGELIGGCSESCSYHTRLRMNLLNEISIKFWAMRRKIAYLSTHSLRKRISMFLCDECDRACGTEFILGMSRDDMADFLGVNRSALSRELGRMRDEGIIAYRKNRFTLLDTDTLILLSEAD